MVTIYPDRGGIGKDAVWPSLATLNSSSYTGGGPGSREWYMDAGVRREAEYDGVAWIPAPLMRRRGLVAVSLPANTTKTGVSSIDTRRRFRILRSSNGLYRVEFRNFYQTPGVNDEYLLTGLGNLTLTAAIESPLASDGAVIPLLFNGRRSVVAEPGSRVISDPFPMLVTATPAYAYVRTRVEVASTSIVIPAHSGPATPTGAGVAYNASSLVYANGMTGYTANTTGAGFSASAILSDDSNPYVIIGDSITHGVGDNGTIEYGQGVKGWAPRWGCRNARPLDVYGYPGLAALDLFCNPDFNPYSLASLLSNDYSAAMIAFGANDCLYNTAAQIKVNYEKGIALLRKNGQARIWVVSVLPQTTSTDGFATKANQTPRTGFGPGGVRDQLNDWLKSLPSGVERYINLNQYVADGSVWVPGNTYDGVHPNTTGHTVISTSLPDMW